MRNADNKILLKILLFQIKRKGSVNIRVKGVSMIPTLFEDDIIIVSRCDNYEIGDILVYGYISDELLVHRLVKKDNKEYYCKGDNAFRLEKIDKEQVIGKVIAVNGKPILKWDEQKIGMSYEVHQVFCECKHSVEKTKQTSTYKQYESLILKG